MRVNLNQMSVFFLVARHGSMTAAAKALYVSPPAVTMQVKKLERWLGFPLFERAQGALRLTDKGRELYEAATPVFEGVGKLEDRVRDMVEAEDVEIKLGTHHLPGNYFIPDLIACIRATYPRIQVQLELGTQDKLLEKLLEQKLDLALFIGEQSPGPAFRTVHLFDEPLALVASATSELGRLESIAVRDLASVPLILQQKGTGARQVVLDFLRGHGVEPQILLDNLSSDVIKQFLRTMNAAALIGRFIVQTELEEGVFHEIRLLGEPPISRFQLAYLDGQYTPAKIRRFLDGLNGFSPRFHPRVPGG